MHSRVKTGFQSELPKTDNTYNPTSQYYGCTLAPGIPLIPNLCRRPLRSPNEQYEYTFTSAYKSFSEETDSNNHNSWLEKKNFINNNHDNGTSPNHLGMTKLTRRRVDFQDSGLDSDSDFDDSQYQPYSQSQNTVTWLSWIITVVTTIVTVITETVYGREDHQNHIHTREPLKHNGGVSWYQYPVLWLYKLALLVHQVDIWLLYKVNSVLKVDSWGTPQQRRKWALIILLIPLIIWAGYKLVEWLWDEDPTSESVSLSTLLLSPLVSLWDLGTVWLYGLWGWFDGSWLSASWTLLTGWFESSGDTVIQEAVEDTAESGPELDFSWPLTAAAAFITSVGTFIGSAASVVSEGAITAFAVISSFLSAVIAWIVDALMNVPTLLSSAFTFLVYPFQSWTWESIAPVDYILPSAPPAEFAASVSPPDPSVDHLLRDKQLLAGLVRHLLASEEFDRALAKRQTTNQEQVNSAVDTAFTAALSKIDVEFNKVKEKLSDSKSIEESSVETKMDALKQQIQELQMALMAHKRLVSEQAALGNRLEARITVAEQEGEEYAKLKEQILMEVTKVRGEMMEQFMNMQLSQKVVSGPGVPPSVPNPTELEAFVNSTVERLLAIYDADKIGKVDYALASSGGSVLSVRCTETFSKKNAQYYMWGYPLWSKAANDPRIALEPAINPGECWAFSGSRGYLVIELSENITVSAFTMEHLPRSLSPTGTIDTAPKDFTVLGLESEQDDTPILLGRFKYEDNGVSLQHFQALEVDHGFKMVELVIESNHGHLEYTCLYRFRVHGRPVRLS